MQWFEMNVFYPGYSSQKFIWTVRGEKKENIVQCIKPRKLGKFQLSNRKT